MKNILNYSRTGKRRAYDPFGALPLGDGFPTPAPILAGNFSKASYFNNFIVENVLVGTHAMPVPFPGSAAKNNYIRSARPCSGTFTA